MSYPNQTQIEIKVYKQGLVAVAEMHGSDNRFNMMYVDKWNEALDLVESWNEVKALVVTGSGKFFSNGIDLNYLAQCSSEEFVSLTKKMREIQHRMLTFPMITIAAINGHCFAGGVILAFCLDYRIMQTGKGWLCLNEVDINMRFPNYPLLLLSKKVNPAYLNQLIVFGTRLNAKEAMRLQVVDRICDEGTVVSSAIKMANELTNKRGYTRESCQNMKQDLYRRILTDDESIPAKL